MNFNLKLVIVGAVGGFLTALMVDLHAFGKSDSNKFDWQLALGRWISGAITGAVTATAGNQVTI